MKKLLALVMAFVLCTGLLGGCNIFKGPTGWAYIEKQDKLIVGLDDTFAPMGFRDTAGELVGFDIDLATEVGKLLGVEIEFKPIDWDAKELELSSKNIDCIWNGMSATEERQEKMSLTKKYLNNRLIIMALDTNVKINSIDDLKNYKIGAQTDSSGLKALQKDAAYNTYKNNVIDYPNYDDAILAMKGGLVDCIVVDEVLGEYKNTKLTPKMTVCNFNFGDDYYAIGCRKGETDLADKINEAIGTLIENGTAKTISEKWFNRNIVILEDYK